MTVFLIEDDPDEQELAKRALYRVDPTVLVEILPDGPTALERIHVVRPSLVLLDVKLPKMDGMEVARLMRAAGLTVPIVMLSSSDDPQDVRRSYEVGANSYVKKPVSFERFRESLRMILSYWLQVNHWR